MSATIIQFPVRSRWSATRVFRLVRTAFALVFLIWVASSFWLGQSATAVSTVDQGSFAYVVVTPGDTLWSIAEKVAPNQNTAEYVQQLVTLNNLSSVNVAVGQRLGLPNN
jgi:hypothetical protein